MYVYVYLQGTYCNSCMKMHWTSHNHMSRGTLILFIYHLHFWQRLTESMVLNIPETVGF